jgi:iron complex outermembrane receptor protein
VSLVASFQLAGGTLKSISAWRDLANTVLLDADGQDTCFGLNLPCLHLFQDQKQDQLSQELQFSGQTASKALDYVVGVYWFRESNEQRTENIILAPFGSNPYSDTALETRSIAAFASATWHMSERWSTTLGIRWTRDEKDFDSAVFNANGSPQLLCVSANGQVVHSSGACTATSPAGSRSTPLTRTLDETWSDVTPRVAVDYKPRDGLMVYASFSEGFKSGAFDGRESSALLYSLAPIAPETVQAFEIGTKAEWFDRRLRTNVALFRNDIDDLQGTGTNQATGTFTRFSVGDVRTEGAELELTAVPVRGLEIAASVGLLDTKYTTVNFDQIADCGPVGTGTKDLEMKFSPRFSSNLGVNYSFSAIRGGEITVGGNWTHKSRFYHSSCNPVASEEDGYDLVDAQVSWQSADEAWRIALAMKNVTNEDYSIGQFFIPGLGFNAIYFNPPRTWTVTARYAFR